MTHKSTGGLPSLACPLIASPAKGVNKDEKGLYQLPFPEVNQKWVGFTFAHLPWVGIKVPNCEDWQLDLVIGHEICHKESALTPFLRFRKYWMFRLYDLMLKTFEEGQEEQIEVPVEANRSGNELQKLWDLVVQLKRASELIEEIFAVRFSILSLREDGKISHGRQRDLIINYKEEYEKFIPGFKVAYGAFDFVAGKIGEGAATNMIYYVLETLNPALAFLDIISAMCKTKRRGPTYEFQWKLSDRVTRYISHSN
jgi:hypothetical protein